jgi:hypothetical protein
MVALINANNAVVPISKSEAVSEEVAKKTALQFETTSRLDVSKTSRSETTTSSKFKRKQITPS